MKLAIPNLSRIAVSQRSVTLFFPDLLSILGGIYAFICPGSGRRSVIYGQSHGGIGPVGGCDGFRNRVQDQGGVDRLEKRIPRKSRNLYRIETSVRPGRADLQVRVFMTTPPVSACPQFVLRSPQAHAGRAAPGFAGGPVGSGPIGQTMTFSDVLLFQAPLRVADRPRLANARSDPYRRAGTRSAIPGRRRSQGIAAGRAHATGAGRVR